MTAELHVVDTAAVILAAGSGTRLGGVAKALMRRGGRTFLQHVVETFRAAGGDQVIVVVGPPYGDAIAQHAVELACAVIVNPRPERGMGSSVEAGFAALNARPRELGAAWLWPVDHPFVTAATLTALAAAAHQGDDVDVVAPEVDGRSGHPVWVHHRIWPELARCGQRPFGARSVLAVARTRRVAVADRGCDQDLDVPADLPADVQR